MEHLLTGNGHQECVLRPAWTRCGQQREVINVVNSTLQPHLVLSHYSHVARMLVTPCSLRALMFAAAGLSFGASAFPGAPAHDGKMEGYGGVVALNKLTGEGAASSRKLLHGCRSLRQPLRIRADDLLPLLTVAWQCKAVASVLIRHNKCGLRNVLHGECSKRRVGPWGGGSLSTTDPGAGAGCNCRSWCEEGPRAGAEALGKTINWNRSPQCVSDYTLGTVPQVAIAAPRCTPASASPVSR